MRIVLPLQTPAPKVAQSLPETVTQSQETVQTEHTSPVQTYIKQQIGPRIENRSIPFYPDLTLRPPPRLPDLKETMRDLLDLDTEINIEENSPYQEVIISETYERLDRLYFKEPSELRDLIDITKLVHIYLPKQMDIDKILDVIKRKVLKGTHLPPTIKEI